MNRIIRRTVHLYGTVVEFSNGREWMIYRADSGTIVAVELSGTLREHVWRAS